MANLDPKGTSMPVISPKTGTHLLQSMPMTKHLHFSVFPIHLKKNPKPWFVVISLTLNGTVVPAM